MVGMKMKAFPASYLIPYTHKNFLEEAFSHKLFWVVNVLGRLQIKKKESVNNHCAVLDDLNNLEMKNLRKC